MECMHVEAVVIDWKILYRVWFQRDSDDNLALSKPISKLWVFVSSTLTLNLTEL